MIDKYSIGIKSRGYSSRNISYDYSSYSPKPYQSHMEPDNSQVIKVGDIN